MKKLPTIVAMLMVVVTSTTEAQKAACKFEVDWLHPEKLNPDGGNANMLGPCSKASDIPPELASTEFVSRVVWWGAFSCGYAAYRNGTQRKANPYHQNGDLIDGWGRGWDQARWNCQHGRWGPAWQVGNCQRSIRKDTTQCSGDATARSSPFTRCRTHKVRRCFFAECRF